MSDVYLYLCDSKKAIAEGKCKGTMCCDVDGYSCCHHTSDINYAKYQKPFSKRSFDIVCFEDDLGDTITSYWEIDPRDLS